MKCFNIRIAGAGTRQERTTDGGLKFRIFIHKVERRASWTLGANTDSERPSKRTEKHGKACLLMVNGNFGQPIHQADEKYIVKPVVKALHALNLICRSARPLTLNDISLQLGIPKTTVLRYLVTLESMGYISQNETRGQYRMSLELWRMTRLTADHEILRDVALPGMRKLLDMYQETINLGVLEGRRITYLNIVETDQNLRLQARIGSTHPIHSTALGKVILAHLSIEEVRDYTGRGLNSYTDKTITDDEAFLGDLRRCRERGYSVEVGENEDGVICIGAAILDHAEYPIAALSISIPAPRMKDHLYEKMGQSLIAVAKEISLKLQK